MRTHMIYISALLLSLLFGTMSSRGHEDGHYHQDAKIQLRESPADSLIELYKSKISEDPDDYYNYTKLGESYIQKGREVGGRKPYHQAEQALRKAVELYPDGYAAYIYLGQVSSYTHNFQQTIEYAKKAIKLKPEKSVPYGLLGDAYMELGRYEEAGRAYQIASMISPGFYSLSRISQLKDVTGDTSGAILAMKESIELAESGNLPIENRAWANVMLGSLYLKEGNIEEAEGYYEKALETFQDYYLALGQLAQLHIESGEYDEAAVLYERAIKLNPRPQYYLALGKVYEELGMTEKSEASYRKAEEGYKEYSKNGIKGHSRELVLYYTDNDIKLDRALKLAKKDSADTEDIYAFDTLAWAYYKTGNIDEARDAINKSLRMGTKDAVLYYHAGMIYYKLNKSEEAEKYFRLVLETNPFFDKDAVKNVRYTLGELDKADSR